MLKPQLPLDSLMRDVTAKWLGELEAWLEQKFFRKANQMLQNLAGYIHFNNGNLGNSVGDWLLIRTLGDGVTTGKITVEANSTTDSSPILVQNNASAGSGIQIENNGTLTGTGRRGIYIDNNVNADSGHQAMSIENNGTGDMNIDNNGGDLSMFVSGNMVFQGLPTTDPSASDAVWVETDGVLVLSGATYSPGGGGGGGFSPTMEIAHSAATFNISSGASSHPNLTHQSGATLLSYTSAFRPTVVASGTYAISGEVDCLTSVTAGKMCFTTLQAGSVAAQTQATADTVNGSCGGMSLAMTSVMSAGDPIEFEVFNVTGGTATFTVTQLAVVRLA